MSVTFGLAKSRHFYHILLYMSMCIFVYIFFVLTLFLSGWGLYDPTFGMMKMQTQLCVAFYLLYCLIFSLFSDE